MLTKLEHRGQHGLLQILRLGTGLPCEKYNQASAKDFCGIATELRQNSFIAGRNVALKIGIKDRHLRGAVGAQGTSAGCFTTGKSRIISPNCCRWMFRIAIGCCHSARLELILTQGTGSAGNMQRTTITKVIGNFQLVTDG